MAEFIDFSNCRVNPLKWFGGANGNKISIHYAGADYMLKFPARPKRAPQADYTNSCVSEYLACHIFQSLGIPAQETLLGTYRGKPVVACKDLETDGYELKDFAFLKNTIIDSEQNGYGTELEDILLTFEEQQILPPAALTAYFWEMFAGDALVGNFDRHNGNWGFLINRAAGNVRLAPIYDCGSCLYPQLSDSTMEAVLADPDQIDDRIYVFPNSAIRLHEKKINYAEFLCTTQNPDCLAALQRICRRIDLPRIGQLIDDAPGISGVHKTFVKTMIQHRKEKLLDHALQLQAEHLAAPAAQSAVRQLCAAAKDRAGRQNASSAPAPAPEQAPEL